MSQAIARPNWTPGGSTADLAQWFTQQRANDPSYQAPGGYKWDGDQYSRSTADWQTRLGQAGMIAGIAAMAYGGGSGIANAMGSGASAGAGAGGGGLAGSGEASIAHLGSALQGAPLQTIAGLGGGGGGLGMNASTLGTLGQLGLQGVSALRNRGSSAQDVPYGKEMQQLLALQQSRLTQANPLYEAILKMAMGMLPVTARGAFQTNGQPTAAPAANQAMPRPGAGL